MTKPVEITIVGGGVVGLAIAWKLSAAGLSVHLVDSGHIGSGASWAGAGILPAAPRVQVSDPIDQLRGYSHSIYPQWDTEIEGLTGIDIGFSKCGGLYLARSRGEAATLLAQESWWDDHGIEYERWDANRIRRSSPSFDWIASGLEKGGLKNAWYLPEEYQVRNPRLIQGLHAACLSTGATISENLPVKAIEPQADGSCKVVTSSKEWVSDQVCIASGAWAQRLLEPLHVETGVLPVRGQMLLYKLPEQEFTPVVNDAHRYLVPRSDGHVLAGSCEEEVGFVCHTTEEKISELKAWVDTLMPDWNEKYFVKAWAGLRPGSFDGLPYIGRIPQFPQVLLATGHFRSGLHLAPATADIILALVQGNAPPLDIAAFHVNRGVTAQANW